MCHGSTGGDHIDELYIATAPVDWPMELGPHAKYWDIGISGYLGFVVSGYRDIRVRGLSCLEKQGTGISEYRGGYGEARPLPARARPRRGGEKNRAERQTL